MVQGTEAVEVVVGVAVVVAEGDHNMKILSIIMCVFFIVTWSCFVQAENSIHWVNEREYSVTISDNSNQPILSVTIEYIGKSPESPDSGEEINHNWRVIDTDFYSETFKNLTGKNIYIKTINYFLERGKLHTPRVKGKAMIQAMYGTTEIKPYALLHRSNAWVWAKKDNTLHRMFVFTKENKMFDVDIPLIYQQ